MPESVALAGPDQGVTPGPVEAHVGRGRARKPWSTKRKLVLGAAVLLVLVGGGLGGWFATRPASASAATTHIVTVGYGTIEQTASATGTIAAADTSDLDFAVSGRVTAVNVSVGQSVSAGQALATVDPT
ncbi:MAG: biotin/lipoyl-binding protein, partial [Acidimicrobiales bacterium]